MYNTPIQILYDIREKYPHTHLLLKNGYNVISDKLETGDYIITDGVQSIMIEVKNGLDFIASKLDGRLEEQMNRLSTNEFSMIAIIGDIYKELQDAILNYNRGSDEHKRQMSWLKRVVDTLPTSVENIVNSTVMRKYAHGHRVSVWNYRDTNEFQRAMMYFAKKMETNNLYLSAEKRVNLNNVIDQKSLLKSKRIANLTSIEGIGVGKAKAIAEHFNYSNKRIIDATDEQLMEVKGVSKKLIENIRRDFINDFSDEEIVVEEKVEIATPKVEEEKREIVLSDLIDLF